GTSQGGAEEPLPDYEARGENRAGQRWHSRWGERKWQWIPLPSPLLGSRQLHLAEGPHAALPQKVVFSLILERRFTMEPRKEVLKKETEDRKDRKKNRFQIVKLEERIAPHCYYYYHRRHCGHTGK